MRTVWILRATLESILATRVVVRMHTREYTTSSYIIVPYYIILWILQYATVVFIVRATYSNISSTTRSTLEYVLLEYA